MHINKKTEMLKSKRGRPKNVARRIQIAISAASLFARKGYGASSMAEIAEVAGVSESLLYHYFPRKSEILQALAEDKVAALEALLRTVERAVQKAETCEAFLYALGREYIPFLLRTHHTYVLWLMDVEPFISASAGPQQAAMQFYRTLGTRLEGLCDFKNTRLGGEAAVRIFLAALLTIVMFHVRMRFPLPGEKRDYSELLRDAVDYATLGCLGS